MIILVSMLLSLLQRDYYCHSDFYKGGPPDIVTGPAPLSLYPNKAL